MYHSNFILFACRLTRVGVNSGKDAALWYKETKGLKKAVEFWQKLKVNYMARFEDRTLTSNICRYFLIFMAV